MADARVDLEPPLLGDPQLASGDRARLSGPPPSDEAAALLPVAEVARRCALSTKTIRAAIARGDLRAYKLAGRIRVAPADLAAWIGTNQVDVSGSPEIPAVPSTVRRAHPLALRRLAPRTNRELVHEPPQD
jgi:excisionase family DNA binding protein